MLQQFRQEAQYATKWKRFDPPSSPYATEFTRTSLQRPSFTQTILSLPMLLWRPCQILVKGWCWSQDIIFLEVERLGPLPTVDYWDEILYYFGSSTDANLFQLRSSLCSCSGLVTRMTLSLVQRNNRDVTPPLATLLLQHSSATFTYDPSLRLFFSPLLMFRSFCPFAGCSKNAIFLIDVYVC